ncbi:MAG: cell division protein ZapA [bacterium]|nr:cell division protein ZapA [bacterium]
MDAKRAQSGNRKSIKILGREYKIRSDEEPEHLAAVEEYVDRVLNEIRKGTPDTQDAAVLGLLNIASELLRFRNNLTIPKDRVQALIDLVESA